MSYFSKKWFNGENNISMSKKKLFFITTVNVQEIGRLLISFIY